MDGYKHYIRIDANNIITYGFSNAFESPLEGDIPLQGEQGRHFTITLRNDRGQFKYKLVSGMFVERSQQELEEEWNARPPQPPTLEEQVQALQAVINSLL